MISQISIKGFKQIADETIDLAPVVVLVGPNNSGKISLLQAFSLLAMARCGLTSVLTIQLKKISAPVLPLI